MYLKVEFDNSVSLLTEWSRRCWYNVLEEGGTVQTFGDLKKALGMSAKSGLFSSNITEDFARPNYAM
jgi:hypothetical protein